MALFRRGNTLGLNTQDKQPDPDPQQAMPFVTPDQLNTANTSLRTEITSLITNAMSEVRGTLAGFQAGQPQYQPQGLPAIDDVSDDDYHEALRVGDVQVLSKRERANAEKLARAAANEVNRARAEVTPVIENLSTELASSILGSLPYYPMLKKDVDSLLQTIPAAQRTRQVIEHIYHSVCGRPENLSKIREHEQTQAQQRETELAMASNTTVQRRGTRQPDASFESVFGENLSNPTASLHGSGPLWQGRRSGYDPDSYGRDMGFKDKNDFTRFATAVMSVEDCPLCYSPVIGGKCAPYCKGNKVRGQ